MATDQLVHRTRGQHRAPDIWQPKLNRPPVPLSGQGFVIGVPPDWSPDEKDLRNELANWWVSG